LLVVSRTVFLAILLLSGAAQALPSHRESSAAASAALPMMPSAPARSRQIGQIGKPAGKAGSQVAGKLARSNQAVEVFHVNHHETMQIRMRDANGRPVRGQQKRFDRFLRCHYTNVQHAMSPRLIALIYRTGRHWPGRRVEVVSGYRHPKVAKNPRSPHMKGLACDFRVVGVTNAELRDYLRRNFDKVGVGYYPNSSFVHLDIRKDHSAFWIDYSGPGERALYSVAPGDDLKTGRADRYRPSKIDTSWAEAAGPQAEQPGDATSGASPAAAAPSEQP
jgi:uncharacterized protein YcbK (DUF882 family)